MDRRHIPNQFMIMGPNNHPPGDQPCIPMARSITTDNMTPMDHISRSEVHPNPHWDIHIRNHSNEHRFARPPFDPYSHSSTNQNTSLPPTGPTGHIHHPSQHHHNIPTYKRKIPSTSPGSSSNLYSAGSSSNSQTLTEKPVEDLYNLPQYRGSNLSINGQDSMSNVRSRSRSELEPCVPRNYVQSYASHYYQPTAQSANYPAPVHPVHPSADVASREWNSVPYAASSHGWTPPPVINGPRHESSQFYSGGSCIDVDSCHREEFFRRNQVTSSQNLNVPHAHSTRDSHNYHSQRVTPLHINGLVYSNHTHGGSSSTNETQFRPENFNSRFSRNSPRIAVDAMGGFGLESSFFRDSRNSLDQYQDMRLDIDDMSYEELVALGESIGNVNTGLSEDGMSRCLREKVHYSVDQNHEESACPICLEEYKNGEKVGKMERCGHEYHVECIKKWLVMKKVCPICKSECSSLLQI